MKKTLMLLLALVMCFSLAGCKGNNDIVEEDVNNIENTTSDESMSYSGIEYEFFDDKIEINYAGEYTVLYHFENDIVTFCDMVYYFPSEDAAMAYINTEEFDEDAIVTREEDVVTVRVDFSEEQLSRTTIEEMAKTIAAN